MRQESRRFQDFIILQLLNAEINEFLSELRDKLGSSKTESGIHITVRGPYSKKISGKKIVEYENVIRHEPIHIQGIDVFQNQKESVVYIRAHSKSLKKIWKKPDFPKKKFGFNPHITLHKTTDIRFANMISDFLKREEIELICHEFRLIAFTSKQGDLFLPDPDRRDRNLVHSNSNVLHRVANVVEEYRRRYASNNSVHIE